jgi:four helix bundle protein
MGDHRKLDVWKKAHAASLEVDKLAAGIRASQHRALRNQMVRSAESVAANIVEGSGQESAKEFRRFLRIAGNSANETDYHLLTARDKAIITAAAYDKLSERITEVARMLSGLRKYLKSLEKPARRNNGAGAPDMPAN